MSYRLDKMIKSLRREDIFLPAHLKVAIMAAVRADGFSVKRSPFLRYAVGFASLLVVSAGGTVLASQAALPGNALYPLKRVSETAYASVQPTAQARVAVQEKLIDRRFDEAEVVTERYDETEFDLDGFETDFINQATLASDAWIDAQERIFSNGIDIAITR